MISNGMTSDPRQRSSPSEAAPRPEKLFVLGLCHRDGMLEPVAAGLSAPALRGLLLTSLPRPVRTGAATPRISPAPDGASIAVEGLTPRERQVAERLLAGLSNKEIAVSMKIEVHTVKTYLRHLFAKLAVRSRLEAAARLHATRKPATADAAALSAATSPSPM